MNTLFPSDWRLTLKQKSDLVELFSLEDDETDMFFLNIECQLQYMPTPNKNRPVNKELLDRLQSKVKEIQNIIIQLDKYHKECLGTAINKSTQTLTVLSTTKSHNEADKYFIETTRRNILKLDNKTSTDLLLNSINSGDFEIEIKEEQKYLANIGEIDLSKGTESIVKTLTKDIDEWPFEIEIKQEVLTKEEANIEPLSKISVFTNVNSNIELTLSNIEDEIKSLKSYYEQFSKLDLIIHGLEQAFGHISKYDGVTGAALNPERKVSSSINSKFIKYLSIVLSESSFFQNYDDLPEALSKAMKRSRFLKTKKGTNNLK